MSSKIQTRQIPRDVLAVIERGVVDGGVFRLQGQLERKMYERTSKVLEALGLKWNRKLKGHACVDGDDIAERIEDAIQTRSYEKPNRLEFFATPFEVATRMCDLAEISEGMTVLEPSAGLGHLAQRIVGRIATSNIHCIEVDPMRAEHLRMQGYPNVRQVDFLTVSPAPTFDRILMNPPFRNLADIDHVMRAWEWLKPGGRLVSVMSQSAVFRTTRKALSFQNRLDEFGYYEDLPDEAFKSSGTLVSTVLVVLDKPSL